VLAVALGVQMARSVLDLAGRSAWWPLVAELAFGAAASTLVLGGIVYQLARVGRFSRHDRGVDTEQAVGTVHSPDARPGRLTVLVPSYCEDAAVLRQTVLCAALQNYPDRRVVICLDDPPDCTDPADAAALLAARALPGDIAALLRGPAAGARGAERDYFRRQYAGTCRTVDAEARLLSREFARAADWLDERAREEADTTATDRLFVRLVFTDRAAWCRSRGDAVRRQAAEGTLAQSEVAAAYAELGSLFHVEVTVFERKRFVNTSLEPNKAMNLNAYIALLGGRHREVSKPDGLHLEQVRPSEGPREGPGTGAAVSVPDCTWLLTVDADSLLAHDYAARMVELLSQPRHRRTAICQTPYCAVPGLTGRLERTAASTTDIMYLVHQGSTYFGATYWVGANAMIRVAALRDIATVRFERGHVVERFIQDRTQIEDTESTIDLIRAGWGLHNYPARLAYSATPPDYGSLLIQRRRWANGGLLIAPKLVRSLSRTRPGTLTRALLRLHYLTSTAAVNVALLVMMSVPIQGPQYDLLLPAACLPYLVLYARDLHLNGRRTRDLVGIYALNLLLVPVNLGGVVKSLEQALRGARTPFGRTPKVTTRTPVPRLYLGLVLGLVTLWTIGAVADGLHERWFHCAVSGLNVAAILGGVTAYIGWRHVATDLLGRPAARPKARPIQRPTAVRTPRPTS
jgi:cellulose synthase/poly-beta-1,6-N-acetylglucosamine synthase-like glycosyltransferase